MLVDTVAWRRVRKQAGDGRNMVFFLMLSWFSLWTISLLTLYWTMRLFARANALEALRAALMPLPTCALSQHPTAAAAAAIATTACTVAAAAAAVATTSCTVDPPRCGAPRVDKYWEKGLCTMLL